MTTPNPSMPEPGVSRDAPIKVLAAARRELAGVALVLVGVIGFLVTLGFLVSPLASLAGVFALTASAGLGLCTGEVRAPGDASTPGA